MSSLYSRNTLYRLLCKLNDARDKIAMDTSSHAVASPSFIKKAVVVVQGTVNIIASFGRYRWTDRQTDRQINE